MEIHELTIVLIVLIFSTNLIRGSIIQESSSRNISRIELNFFKDDLSSDNSFINRLEKSITIEVESDSQHIVLPCATDRIAGLTNFTWMKNMNPIYPSGTNYAYENSSLIIMRVNKSDSADYSC